MPEIYNLPVELDNNPLLDKTIEDLALKHYIVIKLDSIEKQIADISQKIDIIIDGNKS